MTQSTAIFWPVIVQVALIYVLYYMLFTRRQAAVKAGKARLSQYRDNVTEPAETLFVRNKLTNQYELPVLFIAGCIALYATGHATVVPVILAWIFVILRIAHAIVHVGQNRMRYRVPLFIAGFAVNGLLWLWLAANIALN
ncbi:MAPEG family protein [Rhizobium sp. LjRoot254]|uniref:MAPEG family protein n=1 Tax=Rhizobium sp. LjRoot254 TaxID=3342297 RepID=UPI003ECF3AF0